MGINITGKGWYIWQLGDDLIPEPDVLAEELVKYGFTHVLIKIADGTKSYYPDLIADYVQALHAKDLIVFGWQYVYLVYPELEASRAMERVKSLGLHGLEIDAEGHAKSKGKEATQRYVNGLAGIGVPVGLSSYRWPSYHPELEWEILLSVCDHVMPQVYWKDANNPREQLKRCVQEYTSRWPGKKIIPTGAAYHELGWQPLPSEIKEFVTACEEFGLSGYNFWEFANAKRYDLYDTVCTVEADEIPDVEPTIPTMVTVRSAKGLNFRSEPVVTNSTIKMTLPRGITGEILEEKIEDNIRWEKISIEGWVAAEYFGNTLAEVK